MQRAFRLFVSSTFQDFGAERRLLHERVFPALQAHCVRRGFSFRAVDMRWGVSDDAQLDQRTGEICLGEVAAAQAHPAPNVLILLGDRYGWVPLPFAIARDAFEALRAELDGDGRAEDVAVLNRIYQHDENHWIAPGLVSATADRTSAYTLRSREDEMAELRAPEAWEPVEAAARAALQWAAERLHAAGRINDDARRAFFRSLTEQEVRAGLASPQDAARTLAWVRTSANAEPGAAELAQLVRGALPEESLASTDLAPGSEAYADAFVEAMTTKLQAAVARHITAVEQAETAPDHAITAERGAHAAFGAERLRVFVGRESNRAAIRAYIAGEASHPLVLTGASGAGKTALMARAAADAAAGSSSNPLVVRYVGATAASADQRALLISLIDDLAALGLTTQPEEWESDENRFVGQVRDLLAALDQPVTIFIDALDQLRAPYRPAWMPPILNPGVKLIVSALDDPAYPTERRIVDDLRRTLPAEAFLAIEALRAQDGADILDGLQEDAARGLTADQRGFVLEQFAAAGASPLYLRIAFAIARRWRSTEDARAHGLADDVTALIGQFFDEVSGVHHHDAALVKRTLGLLAAGREGLSENELIAVLSRDAEVMDAISAERFGAHTDRLPDSVWVRFARALDALLVEKSVDGDPLITFFHRQVGDVVRTRFYEPDRAALHAALARHFEPQSEDGEPDFTRRSLVELPFQLFHANHRERLDALLTDPAWIDEKVQVFGGTTEIVADYDRFARPDDPVQPLIGRTLRLASAILARDPGQAIPQLHGRLLTAGAPGALLAALVSRIPDGAIYETRPALTPATGAEVARLEGHGAPVTALAVLADGRLASGSDDDTIRLWVPETGSEVARLQGHGNWVTALAVLPDGRLSSGWEDGAIRLWDPKTGAEIARLEGHGSGVTALAVLPDGRLASGSRDGTIRLWDPKTGAETARLESQVDRFSRLEVAAFTADGVILRDPATGAQVALPMSDRSVSALAVLPDGRLASGSSDNTIRLWDPKTGAEVARLEGHQYGVNALAVLPDGRLASGSRDGAIRLWDLEALAESAQLEVDVNGVYSLAILHDGRIVSGSYDNTIRLWDPETGAEVARLEGHQYGVNALAVLPDGRLASGSRDGTVRLWDLEVVAETSHLQGHGDAVVALAHLVEGRLASGSRDTTIRLWDLKTGAETARLEGHYSYVAALAVLPDGRLASGSRDNTIRLWAPETGAEIAHFEGHGGTVSALAVLPDGRLTSGSYDNTIRIWDVATGHETARLEGHGSGVTALAVLPDGRLASGSRDGAIRLWDPKTGAETARLEGLGDSDSALALAVLPDGRLASGSWDETIHLRDPETGAEAACLEGHERSVTALAVLADGRLASGSNDNTIRLWDVDTGAEVARLELDGTVGALASLPDGRLVAGDQLGRLHWLAIKGMEGRAPRPALTAPGAGPAVAATRGALADTPPLRLEDAPAADALQPRAAPAKRKGLGGVWVVAALLALLALALAAAAALAFAPDQARDLLHPLIERLTALRQD